LKTHYAIISEMLIDRLQHTATSLDTTFDFNHRVDMIIKEMTVALNPKNEPKF